MNEHGFLLRWQKEKPMHEAWGNFVLSEIFTKLELKLKDKSILVQDFLKIKPEVRLKDDRSLIDKAFYRDKDYINTYIDIEDKVGIRFVVLLIEEIAVITEIIRNNDNWSFEESRHFNSERDASPLIFTYQSVHYVVKSKASINYSKCNIPIEPNIPCEIQIRTILQHAYAELTHDSVYKKSTIIEPKVQRTIAKSMALIETTDDFFSDVKENLNSNSYDILDFQDSLDAVYRRHIDPKYSAKPQKSALVVLDTFKDLIDSNTIDAIEKFIEKADIYSIITDDKDQIYYQSIVIFILYLIKKKRSKVVNNWPLDIGVLRKLATDLGISLEQHR